MRSVKKTRHLNSRCTNLANNSKIQSRATTARRGRCAMRLIASLTFAVVTLITTAAWAEDIVVKLGVLNDMSGLYSDIGGPGAVIAAKMAVEDFNPAAHGMKVEVVGADHQNKPDIGTNIVRQWFDV